jgi:hypothetical protein
MEQNNLKVSLFDLTLEMLNLKYYSNFVIWGSIISYVFNLQNLFYIFFTNLVVNSILALYLVIFKWHVSGYELFYRAHNNKNITFTQDDFKNYNKNNKIMVNIKKITGYIIHVIPIIYFANKSIIKDYLRYKTIDNFQIVFISLLLGCGYLQFIDKTYSMYGKINSNGIFSVGVIISIFVTNYLFP